MATYRRTLPLLNAIRRSFAFTSPPTVRDARGRSVPLVDAARASDLPSDLAARVQVLIAERTMPVGPPAAVVGRRNVLWAVGMVVLMLGWAPFNGGMTVLGVPTFAALPCYLALALAYTHLWQRSARRSLARPIAGAVLAAGHCAACGYPIAGIDPDTDGVTVCPECAAAWRLSPAAAVRPAGQDEANSPPSDSTILRPPMWGLPSRRSPWNLSAPQRLAALDAEGRLVSIVEPRIERFPPPAWDSLPPLKRRLLRQRLAYMNIAGRVLMMVVVWVAAVAMSVDAVRRPLDWMTLAMGAGATLLVAVAVYMTWHVALPNANHAGEVIDLLLAENCCPSCAADMSAAFNTAPIRKDAIVRCPACDAAWRRRPPG